MAFKFASGQEMLDALHDVDLYSPSQELYVFLYNEAGAICYYYISLEEAKELQAQAKKMGEYWSALLGTGGHICDDPNDEDNPPNPGCSNIDFCEDNYMHDWIDTEDVK